MTREEAINWLKLLSLPLYNNDKRVVAIQIAIEALDKQIQWEKTDRFNRMIEAFECDFSLIQQGEKTFAQLDENLKVEKVNVNSLRKDMDLMQELSYLIRHGKAEIWLKEGE